MLLSLVDSLKCPAAHPESSLVLSVEEWSGSRVVTGTLGCPACHTRFAINNGVVDFTSGRAGPRPPDEPLASEPIRIAAQLGLAEPGGVVLLTGRYASLAAGLCELVEVACVVVDVVSGSSTAAATFRLLDTLPLLDGALRGAAIDVPRTTPAFLAEVARCVKERGRIVAHARSALPAGVRLVAHDESEWVGEVELAHPVVPLRRASR